MIDFSKQMQYDVDTINAVETYDAPDRVMVSTAIDSAGVL